MIDRPVSPRPATKIPVSAAPASGSRTAGPNLVTARLAAVSGRDEQPGGAAAQQTQERGAAEIAEIERRRPRHRKERAGAVDRREHDVARCGREHRRQQHAPRQILAVGDFEREHHAGGGRLEDRGHSGGRATHHQHLVVDARERAAEPMLQPRADHGAEIDRGPLEAHGRAAAECGRARQELRRRFGQGEPMFGIVEVLDVFVGRRRRDTVSDPPQDERGDGQTDDGGKSLDPQRKIQQPLEQLSPDGSIEPGHAQPGHGAGDDRQEPDFSSSSTERPQRHRVRHPGQPRGEDGNAWSAAASLNSVRVVNSCSR